MPVACAQEVIRAIVQLQRHIAQVRTLDCQAVIGG